MTRVGSHQFCTDAPSYFRERAGPVSHIPRTAAYSIVRAQIVIEEGRPSEKLGENSPLRCVAIFDASLLRPSVLSGFVSWAPSHDPRACVRVPRPAGATVLRPVPVSLPASVLLPPWAQTEVERCLSPHFWTLRTAKTLGGSNSSAVGFSSAMPCMHHQGK